MYRRLVTAGAGWKRSLVLPAILATLLGALLTQIPWLLRHPNVARAYLDPQGHLGPEPLLRQATQLALTRRVRPRGVRVPTVPPPMEAALASSSTPARNSRGTADVRSG